jgi:hypothetical protein
MSFLHTLLKTRLRIPIISLIILITFISTVVLFRIDSRGIKMKFIAQTPPGDFLITTEKATYQANETTITTITSAMPNTPIYWQNVINDIEVTPGYQYGQTDANGNFSRVIENHSQYGQGRWKFFVAVGGISKYVEFVVVADPEFTVNCRECSMQDGVTFSLVGATPNSPIYWSSSRNYILTGENEAFYGHTTDQYGRWTGSTGSLVGVWQPGQWVKEVKVGGTYLTVEFAVGAPYAETGSLAWYALRAKAERETESIIFQVAEPQDDFFLIDLCQAVQKYSLIRGNVKEKQIQVMDSIIFTWLRVETLEVMRNRPSSGSAYWPTPPPEILSHLGPNDFLVFYAGGSTMIDGMKVTYELQHSPDYNLRWEFNDLEQNKNSFESILIIDWDRANRIADLPLFDKSVTSINLFNGKLIQDVDAAEELPGQSPPGMESWITQQLAGGPTTPSTFFTLTQLRQWLASHPDC